MLVFAIHSETGQVGRLGAPMFGSVWSNFGSHSKTAFESLVAAQDLHDTYHVLPVLKYMILYGRKLDDYYLVP
jgi:hypothetical protein